MSEEEGEIEEYIQEYLRYWELNNSVDVMEEELKKKSGNSSNQGRRTGLTKLELLIKGSGAKSKVEAQLEKEVKQQNKKYQEVLQAGRQIFSVSINLLQIIHNIKEQSSSKYESLNDTLETLKIQLGKNHKIIINEGKVEGSDLISQTIIKEHKSKLERNVQEKNIEGIIEVLLSLRVNALQIAPELRKALTDELIRRDIFKISQGDSFEFLLGLLGERSKPLRHAITSLISVVVSTIRGIEYITNGGNDIILQRIIKIMKEQEVGSVTQRFCLAILQKCSVKESIIGTYIDHDLIGWVLSLVKKSLTAKVHIFCLDFSTAMLANIIHSKWCQIYLEKKADLTAHLIDSLLKLIRESLEVSVLMHLLITLSYLSKDKFRRAIEETNMVRRITEFAEFYDHHHSKGNLIISIQMAPLLKWIRELFSIFVLICFILEKNRKKIPKNESVNTKINKGNSSSNVSKIKSTDPPHPNLTLTSP